MAVKTTIPQPTGTALGTAGIFKFPKAQREVIVDIIDTVNDAINGTISTTDLTLSGDLVVGDDTTMTGRLDVDDTTASTSTITGAVVIDGGVGIAKELFVSTTTPASISATGVLSVTNATDATTPTTGSAKFTGGVGIAKALYVGTSVNATTYVTSGNGTVALPAIGPVSDPDSGLYVIGANNLGMSLAGAKVVDFKTTGIDIVGDLKTSGGTETYWLAIKGPSAVVSVATGAAIVAADLVKGYIRVTGATGSVALPSAADITTALGTSPVGTSFDFIINAKDMTAANVVTLTVGANTSVLATPIITGSGTLTVAQDVQVVGKFTCIYDTETSIKLIRVA